MTINLPIGAMLMMFLVAVGLGFFLTENAKYGKVIRVTFMVVTLFVSSILIIGFCTGHIHGTFYCHDPF
jgi:uncharacterized membrane protein (UPF0182 family)